MTVNRWLAEERGLSEETIERIDYLYALIENLIKQSIGKPFSDSVYSEIEGYEEKLQGLWGFSVDKSRHTWKLQYKFKNQWVGKKYRCSSTGVEFTIPFDVNERDYYQIGEAALDVGRLDGYYRVIGNLEEIK